MGQQEVHEYEAFGDHPRRHLYCWLTSFSQSLQTNLRKTLDTTIKRGKNSNMTKGRKLAKSRKQKNSDKSINKEGKVAFVTLLISIVTLIVTVFGFSFRHTPTAYIQEQAMSVSYLSKLRDEGGTYPLFMDDITDLPADGYFDKCATQVLITNDYDNEILLEEMILEVEDLEVNMNPVLEIHLDVLDYTGESLICTNVGWGDALNVTISFDGEDLDRLIPKEKHSIFIPKIECGEKIEIKLWENSDLLLKNYTGDITAVVNCTDADNNIITISSGDTVQAYVFDGEFSPVGGLGPSKEIYGIEIDTSKTNSKYMYTISETIKGKERLELPICFYPDKSCKFRGRVTFVAIYNSKNDRMNISTDWVELEFRIPSIDYEKPYDVSKYSEDYLLQKVHDAPPGYVLVTYPAVDKSEMEGIELEY